MTWLMEPEFWVRLLGIILIDISLAGDNALVIALAVRGLPQRQQLLGRIWGTAGAVALRRESGTSAALGPAGRDRPGGAAVHPQGAA